ncbi:hypothetical protein KPL70_012524 [Citrus sinensis]|uniref:Helicase MOV-10-like beta-barrel domain-containing protein n=1 Tax=Citrus clementina TaxID=85681 RepID=V4SSP9_CITCL|nr:probable RNA helicase SDE3 [Citrus x clementina]ESR50863.1 hypothetical protein CICLE_v10030791mg [Citrus x clementina]KAH9707304.1 hypothetical protein KPL70_012524 [Citrus sinensis]GAY46936.1 hypothetical protein CUMW_100770 [Citrus unshiu]
MFKWMFIGCAGCVLGQILRYISSDQDHGTESKTSKGDPSRGSASLNTSVRNSSYENNDRQDQSDRTQIKYYDYYPNLPTSSSTTKRSGAVSIESEYVNKFMEGTDEASSRLKYRTSQPPFSSKPSLPKPASVSSKPSVSPTEPPPSSSSPKPSIPSFKACSSFSTPVAPPLTSDQPRSSAKQSPSSCGPSQSPSVPTSSSPSTPESSKPTQCPLCFNPTNEQMKSNNTRVPKGASFPKAPQSSKPTRCPFCFNPTEDQMKANYPKDIESPIEKDIEPEDLKNPLSQKAPSSSLRTLSPLPPDSKYQQENDRYILVEKGASNYKIPEDIEDLIKKDIVPHVLEKPLSPSTYKDYFAALLYAEDFYIEKWSDFQLFNVTLELHKAAIYDKSLKNKNLEESDETDDKLFVAFEINSVPERRPFLLSRDFVYAQRSGGKSKKFQGILYRVVKSNVVLVEFEEDFYSLHHPKYIYDISFSFNRVCLKRAHQAIAAASRSLFKNYLFPDFVSRKNISSSETCLYGNRNLDSNGNSVVRRILSLHGSPPYLVEGPLCATSDNLSKTGLVVQEAVLEIYKRSSQCRILVCAPINRTGDVLMRSLKKKIPKSDMFRANAAFREVDGVPVDILPSCLYEEGKGFQLPSLQELMQFRVIFSTFTSSFRLHNEGIPAGHFSHIFLLDASSATEPETMIALTNLANENTTVILTGAPNNRTSWVRSDIARKTGLRVSYFERLHATQTYSNFDPTFITML